ncbi:subclass B3 metallo-beta-lactamase [Mucilaginibacter sp. McL0603]|uniref:subclass B3 metallo-beta-lactamase n=1 Tax=Mucilaginibacter sp. McL0603 TaxID=3415670 RepID=UPI003CF5D949
MLFSSLYSIAQKPSPSSGRPGDWSKPYKPFRIAGNLYYVGTDELACFLITTPQGHILINTGAPGSAPLIYSSIAALGFKFSDIKILLTTHAHLDHVGSMAEIKKITGAKVMIEANDAPVLADGGNSDYEFGGKGNLFEPIKADSLLHDHDTIKFGGMQIIMLHHPGHTKGACSFLFDVKDGHRSYRVLIANMPTVLDEAKLPSMPTYPDVGKDYAYTLNAMKEVQFDIWVAAHASQFGLHEKHKPGDAYNPKAFSDRKGYDLMIDDLKKDYLRRLNGKSK